MSLPARESGQRSCQTSVPPCPQGI
ncbi:A630095N17Rik [Phodopus roborovskii]|uniref:A630095N17Rik protein n=1 Tax=Phodopus roborovskii TaxID=109678 RepID=A0AAU9ZI23_PHORO|nr:A630095N17Rik [Phodopus roborovskii]